MDSLMPLSSTPIPNWRADMWKVATGRERRISVRRERVMAVGMFPSRVSNGNLPSPGSGKRSRNAEVFEQMRPHFDNTIVSTPTRATSSRHLDDRAALAQPSAGSGWRRRRD